MKLLILFFGITFFSIFLGAQVTEAVLLVPYWKSLPPTAFYTYYDQFGHTIGQFYTVLTIIAALLPVLLALYCSLIKSNAFKFALISSFFAALFIASFYVYFKAANQLFFEDALSPNLLKEELIIWGYWHWGRIGIECISLIFFVLSAIKLMYERKHLI